MKKKAYSSFGRQFVVENREIIRKVFNSPKYVLSYFLYAVFGRLFH